MSYVGTRRPEKTEKCVLGYICRWFSPPSDCIQFFFSVKKKLHEKWRKLYERVKQELSNGMICLSKFSREHYENLGRSYLVRIPPPEKLNNWQLTFLFFIVNKCAYHGANSAALLPESMQNRFPCVYRPGVGGRLIWIWLSGYQWISTQSIPPRLFSEVLSPKSPLSLVSSSPNCHISWLLLCMDGAALARILHVAGCPSPSHRCCPIVVF
jgi:hypothetical protein